MMAKDAFPASGAQVNHDVIVNTSLDPLVHVTRVYSTLEDGMYGVGQDIPVTIAFSAPVGWFVGSGRGGGVVCQFRLRFDDGNGI